MPFSCTDAVLWTARLAVACYLARILLLVRRGTASGSPTLAECILWTAGCVVFLAHVAAAFQFVHHWSHAAAWSHTARQTAAVTGLDWGGGLIVNYLFTLLWTIDAARVWIEHRRQRTIVPRGWAVGVQIVFAFLVVNATVVFGPSYWIPIAAVYLLLLLAVKRYAR